MSDMEITHSQTLGAIAKALAAAQSEMSDAKKDSVNPHFRNKYAGLSSVRTAITPALTKHGIAAVQLFEPHGLDGICVVSMLIHESGEWIKSRLAVPLAKKDAQGVGSAATYARRYALAAITGIAADDDDDGEAAVGKRQETPASKPSAEAVSAEAAYAKRLDEVADADALAKIHAEVAKAVQAGILDDKARGRLREKSQSAIKRLGTPANGTAA